MKVLSLLFAFLTVHSAAAQELAQEYSSGQSGSFECTTEGETCCLTGDIGTFSNQGTTAMGDTCTGEESTKASFECTGSCTLTCSGDSCSTTAASSTSETAAPTDLVGASYCTYSPDTTCYPSSNGWPACCADESCENNGVGDAPACEKAANATAAPVAGETSPPAESTPAPTSGATVASTGLLGIFSGYIFGFFLLW